MARHFSKAAVGGGFSFVLFSAGASPAFALCPGQPTSGVYAYVCSQTDNLGDGASIYVNNGDVQVSTSGLTGIDTTSLHSSNARQAFLNGQFGLTGTSGQVSSTESESESRASGATGGVSATASEGDLKSADFLAVPFANGKANTSNEHFGGNAVVPSLHASANGSAMAPSSGAISVSSGGSAYFSDVLSMSRGQLAALNSETNSHMTEVYVLFSYSVSGSISAGPIDPSSAGFASATAGFDVTLTGLPASSANLLVDPATASGTAFKQPTFKPNTNMDNLSGETFVVESYISPTQDLGVQAWLSVQGSATAAYGVGGSYSVNYSDTAAFNGLSFYADPGLTERLPDIQVNSALGFDYIPSDATFGVPAAPEASTWAMVVLGFAGLALVSYRSSSQRAVARA